MIKIVTVCGNGIGSSLMLKMKIEEICEEQGIPAQVESSDFNAALGKDCDLLVTVKELASQLEGGKRRVAVIRNYINKKKITADILPVLQELNQH
ncbi:MAG: maltose transporter subunit [Sporolactobacillus laevolacticus]|jgi:PTS system ascorbate-specific IIB component|nr:maltose transporter subunit [Sporolactobacillus laevolacticus]